VPNQPLNALLRVVASLLGGLSERKCIVNLADAPALKQSLLQTVVLPAAEAMRSSSSMPTRSIGLARGIQPTLALGVAPGTGPGDYQVALRIQDRLLEHSRTVELIRQQAGGEVDERFVGTIQALAPTASSDRPWYQRRQRPLRIGASIGHVAVTAGTLGGFVRRRQDGSICLLSNNHVLADENQARVGEAILQPGAHDEGEQPDDIVAELADFVELKHQRANAVDAAAARLLERIEHDPRSLGDLGKLSGIGMADFEQGVAKIGRTTGLTRGQVTAIELEGVAVGFGQLGVVRFDGQIEIQGNEGPFSSGGDSGSLIVDASCRAVALLFAGPMPA
jgi:hypothetical protein